MCRLAYDDTASALAKAELLLRTLPDEEHHTGALVTRAFTEAILERAAGQPGGGGNLYLDARPPGAQLRAFELLRLRTPLIPFAYAAANRAILHALEEPSAVTLVDIGVGRGGQVRGLLHNPMTRQLVSSLRVVGVEPDSSVRTGTGALEIAREQILGAAREAGIATSFHGIPKRAEELRVGDIGELEGVVIVNAGFALHHVADAHGDRHDRVGVLELLRDVGAHHVVLVEPDSNHFTSDLSLRFLNAYRHYRSVWSSLHASLTPSDAELVWNEFFAPEVRNTIACEGELRTERHEEHRQWAEHLRRAGWVVDAPPDLVPRSGTPAGFAIVKSADGFSLAFGGVVLLSVLSARRA